MTLCDFLATIPMPPESLRGYCNGLVVLITALGELAKQGLFGDNEELIERVLELSLDTLERQWGQP